ncbi:MAG: hypothetical protein WC872_01955 [Candidatus Absconditabacterales bacterium]
MELNENEQKIIKNYSIVYKIIFQYLIFFVLLIIASFISYQLINKTDGNLAKSGLEISKINIILEFNKFFDQKIKNKDVNAYILNGIREDEGDYIQSFNNLISYKGFIIPKYFSIYKTLPLKNISYFEQSDYDVKEIENTVKNLVFTSKKNWTNNIKKISFPLDNNILETFNLKCLFENKLYQKTCDWYIQNFIDSFFVYNISSDYQGLQNAFDHIGKINKHKINFCNGMKKYVFYSNDINSNIRNIFEQCSKDLSDFFKKFEGFVEIQKQLDDKYINNFVYNDNALNEYKLLSFQQIIYADFLNNRINLNRLNLYFDFVKELLKRNGLENFYKDEIYWYNNYYLYPNLQTNFNYDKNNLQVILIGKSVNTINNGSYLIGFKGLVEQIKNKKLINNQTGVIENIVNTGNQDLTYRISKKIEGFGFLTITNKFISNDKVNIQGYFDIKDDNENLLKVIINLIYKNDSLIVYDINVNDHKILNDVLKDILAKKEMSLREVYDYIAQNLFLYQQDQLSGLKD